VYSGAEFKLHSFLTLELFGGKMWASLFSRFTFWKTVSSVC